MVITNSAKSCNWVVHPSHFPHDHDGVDADHAEGVVEDDPDVADELRRVSSGYSNNNGCDCRFNSDLIFLGTKFMINASSIALRFDSFAPMW